MRAVRQLFTERQRSACLLMPPHARETTHTRVIGSSGDISAENAATGQASFGAPAIFEHIDPPAMLAWEVALEVALMLMPLSPGMTPSRFILVFALFTANCLPAPAIAAGSPLE